LTKQYAFFGQAARKLLVRAAMLAIADEVIE